MACRIRELVIDAAGPDRLATSWSEVPAPLQAVGKNSETLLHTGVRACRRGASALTARPVVPERISRQMVLAATFSQ
jgi:hypothetical protein